MTQKDKLQEEYEAAFARLALLELEDGEADCLERLDDRLKECGEYARIPPISRGTRRRWGKALKRSRRQKIANRLRGPLGVAAALLAVFSAVSAYAFREDIRNFSIELHEKYLAAGGNNHTYVSMDGLYSPSYQPEGYVLSGNPEQPHGLVYLSFRESGGAGTILFQQSVTKTGMMLDTEHAQSIESILIGESPGTLIVRKDGSSQLLWGEGRFLLSASEAGAEELVRMAEGMVLIGGEPVK